MMVSYIVAYMLLWEAYRRKKNEKKRATGAAVAMEGDHVGDWWSCSRYKVQPVPGAAAAGGCAAVQSPPSRRAAVGGYHVQPTPSRRRPLVGCGGGHWLVVAAAGVGWVVVLT